MALGDLYITNAELRSYMKLDKPGDGNDGVINDVVAAVTQEINRHCGRQFQLASTATARVFSPLNQHALIMDDVSSATGFILKTDEDNDGVFETTWDAADYELSPLNQVQYGQEGWPYFVVKAVGQKYFRYSRRVNVQITAKWGWSAVPAPVKQAAKIMAADAFQLKDARLGLAGSDTFGQVIRVKDSGIACAKLKSYRRGRLLVA